jgi:hypothetical protein
MACINPPALGDDQLLLYLDDNADPGIHDHISTCSYCRAQAAALANFQARLTAGLYRKACPSPQELGDYQLNLIAADRRLIVQQHLQECPHCTGELHVLGVNLSEQPSSTPDSPLKRIKILIARLSDGLEESKRGISPMPIFAGLRGESGGPERYIAEDIEITIEVQLDPESPANRALLGLILGESKSPNTATLSIGAEIVASEPVDSFGNFMFTNLHPGTYDLLIQGHDSEIHIPTLDV